MAVNPGIGIAETRRDLKAAIRGTYAGVGPTAGQRGVRIIAEAMRDYDAALRDAGLEPPRVPGVSHFRVSRAAANAADLWIADAERHLTIRAIVSRMLGLTEDGAPRTNPDSPWGTCERCHKRPVTLDLAPAREFGQTRRLELCDECGAVERERREDARIATGETGRRATLPNPALILVTGNPRPPAEVEAAWLKFHDRDEFTGTVRNLGRIAGTPDYTFALGRCVDLDLGRGTQRFTPMPWLVYSPVDESLWIVAEAPLKFGTGVAGAEVRSVTYSPQQSSGKDPARYRHRFLSPRPTLAPIGNPNYCRAALFDGGGYHVDDWVRN